MRLIGLVLAVALGLGALLGAPGLAAGQLRRDGHWRTALYPAKPSGPGISAISARSAALAANGDGLVAWWREYGNDFTGTRRRDLDVVDVRAGRPGRVQRVARAGTVALATTAASGGRALIVFIAGTELRVAVRERRGARWHVQRAASDNGSPINALTAIAAPDGGWVVAERLFTSSRVYHLRVLRLDRQGRRLSDQDLGPGTLGLGRFPSSPLAATGRRVWLTGDGEGGPTLGFMPGGAGLWSTPGGQPFGAKFALQDTAAADPRLVAGNGQVAAVWTVRANVAESGPYGAPRIALAGDSGVLGAPVGPQPRYPQRLFNPSAAPVGNGVWLLAWQEKTVPRAFSPLAPIKIARLRGGRLESARAVTRSDVQNAIIRPLAGQRALLSYELSSQVSLVVLDAQAHATRIHAPSWPPVKRGDDPSATTTVTAGHWVALVRGDRAGLRVAITQL